MKYNIVVPKDEEVKVGYEFGMLDKLDGYGNPINKKYVVVEVYGKVRDFGKWSEWSVEAMACDGSLRHV